jgi:hypothetical protein
MAARTISQADQSTAKLQSGSTAASPNGRLSQPVTLENLWVSTPNRRQAVSTLTLATSGHHSPWQRVGITHPTAPKGRQLADT